MRIDNTSTINLMKKISIYTDGSCLGNPGPGGYGAILEYGAKSKSISKGFKLTTNNRMELMAPTQALKQLKEKCIVNIYTDSQYVKNGINQWIINWKKNGWRTSSKAPVKNVDLWQALDKMCQNHEVKWHWVKAHNGHPQNEAVDELARMAASGKNLAIDEGFAQ